MKGQVRDLLKRRFPLCDDAYFEKVAGEIDALYRDNVDYEGIDPVKWKGVTNWGGVYYPDDQGIMEG